MNKLKSLVVINFLILLSGCVDIINEEFFERYMKDDLTKNFIDPQSAQFRFDKVEHSSSYTLWCGTVNAKNSFGGYVGAKPFVYSLYHGGKKDSANYVKTSAVLIEGEFNYETWKKYYDEKCR